MEVKTIEELVTKVNNDLGESFCNDFRYKRKELAHLYRASSKILFKFIDPERDWVINEGGGVEIQFHLYYRENEIGYGLGFNAQYVPYATNDKSPVDCIRPFVDAFIKLKEDNNQQIKRLESKGFSLIGKTDYSCLKSIHYNDYYLFGKTISAQNGIISDDNYTEMIKTIKTDLYNLYIAIWEQKNKTSQMSEEMDKYLQIINSCKNVILTGAPGTGKTYLAKEIAQQMIFGEIKEHLTEEEQHQFDEQCGFVQFHPSYDYTDFVEGLRPIKAEKELGFKRKDGVFKDFCKKAIEGFITKEMIKNQFFLLWKDIQERKTEHIPLFSGKESLRMIVNDSDQKTINFSKKNDTDNISDGNNVTLDDIYTIILEKHINTIDALKAAGPDRENLGVNGNHVNKWAVCNYILEKINGKPYIFIIDEINRGEISKVFGELFFSIDPDYRGKEKGAVKTQYQNLIEEDDEFYDGFFVPENVYIIGTMNDIDRSVESMDFAFRRRFAFKEIKAVDRVAMLDDLQWKEDAIERMEKLNAAIEKIEGLSSAYHIGPAYFLKLKNYNGDFDQLWENHIEGLLFEYMRGMTDVNANLKALANAYGYSNANNYDQPSNN